MIKITDGPRPAPKNNDTAIDDEGALTIREKTWRAFNSKDGIERGVTGKKGNPANEVYSDNEPLDHAKLKDFYDTWSNRWKNAGWEGSGWEEQGWSVLNSIYKTDKTYAQMTQMDGDGRFGISFDDFALGYGAKIVGVSDGENIYSLDKERFVQNFKEGYASDLRAELEPLINGLTPADSKIEPPRLIDPNDNDFFKLERSFGFRQRITYAAYHNAQIIFKGRAAIDRSEYVYIRDLIGMYETVDAGRNEAGDRRDGVISFDEFIDSYTRMELAENPLAMQPAAEPPLFAGWSDFCKEGYHFDNRDFIPSRIKCVEDKNYNPVSDPAEAANYGNQPYENNQGVPPIVDEEDQAARARKPRNPKLRLLEDDLF